MLTFARIIKDKFSLKNLFQRFVKREMYTTDTHLRSTTNSNICQSTLPTAAIAVPRLLHFLERDLQIFFHKKKRKRKGIPSFFFKSDETRTEVWPGPSESSRATMFTHDGGTFHLHNACRKVGEKENREKQLCTGRKSFSRKLEISSWWKKNRALRCTTRVLFDRLC